MPTTRNLLISLKLHVRDRLEHEKTVLNKLDSLIALDQTPTDSNLTDSVMDLCRKFGVSYRDVVEYAEGLEI